MRQREPRQAGRRVPVLGIDLQMPILLWPTILLYIILPLAHRDKCTDLLPNHHSPRSTIHSLIHLSVVSVVIFKQAVSMTRINNLTANVLTRGYGYRLGTSTGHGSTKIAKVTVRTKHTATTSVIDNPNRSFCSLNNSFRSSIYLMADDCLYICLMNEKWCCCRMRPWPNGLDLMLAISGTPDSTLRKMDLEPAFPASYHSTSTPSTPDAISPLAQLLMKPLVTLGHVPTCDRPRSKKCHCYPAA